MSLIAGIQEEMNRNRELLQQHQQIGQSGLFASTMLKDKIKEAEEAIASGDVVRMLTAYKTLQDSK